MKLTETDNGFLNIVLSTNVNTQLGDKVNNTEMLSRLAVKEPQFHNNIARLKMAYGGHVQRGSSSYWQQCGVDIGRQSQWRQNTRTAKKNMNRRH